MEIKANPQQLVIRIDTASGVAKVGWAAELPLGRFEHIDLVCEAAHCQPLTKTHPHYADYLQACIQAKKFNAPVIQNQYRENRSKSWLPVPLDLNDEKVTTNPDDFGNYQTLAMHTFFRLCRNHSEAWAVVEQNNIIQLQSRKPPWEMEELEYQVWFHHTLQQLAKYPGEIKSGNLAVQPSGLWFIPDN